MCNANYCLSGEFSGQGENCPWEFRFLVEISLGDTREVAKSAEEKPEGIKCTS